MPVPSATTASSRFRLQAWRVVTCLLWLLAAFGILQYSVHVWQVAHALRSPGTGHDAHAALLRMVMWGSAYLACACVTLAVATGALLTRGWARVALRVVAVLLALWFLVTAIQYGARLMAFIHDSQMLLAQPHMADAARLLAARVRRSYEVTIALKAVAVPVLVWLAWRLGVPSVRGQFPAWPARKVG
ncbi:MAG TPA: hypothetical protein VF269_07440 [Rhodanobacteraceae bacterium]